MGRSTAAARRSRLKDSAFLARPSPPDYGFGIPRQPVAPTTSSAFQETVGAGLPWLPRPNEIPPLGEISIGRGNPAPTKYQSPHAPIDLDRFHCLTLAMSISE